MESEPAKGGIGAVAIVAIVIIVALVALVVVRQLTGKPSTSPTPVIQIQY